MLRLKGWLFVAEKIHKKEGIMRGEEGRSSGYKLNITNMSGISSVILSVKSVTSLYNLPI